MELESAIKQHQQGNIKEAEELYKKILHTEPEQVDALHLLGVSYLQQDKFQQAIDYISQAIKLDPKQAIFYNNLGNAYCKQNNIKKAVRYYKLAIKLDHEQFSNLFITISNLLIAENLTKNAEEFLHKWYNKLPYDVNLLSALANVYIKQNKLEESIEFSRSALQFQPNHIPSLNHMGNALFAKKDLDGAEKYFNQALNENNEAYGVYYNLANLYKEQQKFTQAIESYNKCLSINPKFLPALNNLANAMEVTGNLQEAKKKYKQAIAINSDYTNCLYNLANLYQSQGEYSTAINYYQQIINKYPQNVMALNNYGNCLYKLNNIENAIVLYKQAIKYSPNNPDFHYNLGSVYLEQKNIIQAIKYLENTLKLAPDYLSASAKLFYANRSICNWDYELVVNDSCATSIDIKYLGESPYINVLRTDDLQANLQVANKWSKYIKNNVRSSELKSMFCNSSSNVDNPGINIKNGNNSSNKIKIGYLSNDFKEHATMHLMASMFAMHDLDKFEIYFFSYGKKNDSKYYEKLQNDKFKFFNVLYLSYHEIAKLIHSNHIDILIDLKGYSQNARTEICALKPAPIQVNYLGFPGTMGANFYDYIIADRNIIKEQEQKYYTEKVKYMPNCYQVTDCNQEIGKDNYTREKFDLPESKVILACFNQSHKIDKEIFSAWMAILQQVPSSVLWLYTDENSLTNINLIKHAAQYNISKDRLVFAKYLPKAQHLRRMQLADIILDTRVYNGHTSTTDALWAGVPVVTILGNHFASRVSSSILHTLGVKELIATTKEQYIDKTVYLASNTKVLKQMKNKINRLKVSSPLFDTKQFTKDLETLYVEMLNGSR